MCSSVEGYVGSFQFLAVTNKAAVNMAEQMFLWFGGTSLGICSVVLYLGIEVDQLLIF